MEEEKKTKCGNLQNRHYYITAEMAIKNMTSEQRRIKIEELKEIGYEYNEYLYLILEEEVIIPYDFILFCLLVEKEKESAVNRS